MTLSTDSTVLSNEIAARMPLLDRRVRKRELEGVVSEALAQGDTSPEGFLKLAAGYADRVTVRRARLETLRTTYAKAATLAQRDAVIAQALREEGAPPRAFAALKRGWLDLDAMAERAELEAHDLEVRRAMAIWAAAARTSKEELGLTISPLLELLISPLSSVCAVACAEALLDLLERAPKWRVLSDAPEQYERWEQLCQRLLDPHGPRRVQAAAMKICLRAVPGLALQSLETLLLREGSGDEFLMRQHAVTLLGQRADDRCAFELLLKKVQLGDASEHVRIALPAALRTTGGAAAVTVIEALAGTLKAAHPLLRTDESPRVRSAAAIALAELLCTRAADTIPALTRLLFDPDPLVYQITAEEIEALAQKGRLSEAEALALAEAVARRAALAKSAAQAEPALRAQEALATLTDWPLAIAHSLLAHHLAPLPQGESIEVATPADPLTFGRLLSYLAREGFGFYAKPVPGGYHVEHGPRFTFRTWRLLHELRWLTPYKRQDTVHTVGREIHGVLRAPSRLLAEATTTSVPGEPLASPTDGTWGPHLPTLDDVLSMSLGSAEPVRIFTTRGLTEVAPPRTLLGRLRARASLTVRYAELAELRLRALDPADPSERTRYVQALEALGFRVTLRPYPVTESATVAVGPAVSAPFGRLAPALGMAPGALALLATPEALNGLIQYVLSPAENTLGQLGCAALLIGTAMFASNLRQHEQIRRSRTAIPLVIGGWGTRGKSGTERLKAAMLHAQDIDVLVKTTGCEAMFIHGVPGRRPTEIFIHRSYDKATIWEQREVLNLASRLRVSAFLWECMALSGPLVKVLSEEWMRDDLQTLTNAYPDHEDVQGPAGHDVAQSIAGFIRSDGTTLTTEEQMLPILAEEARRKRARLVSVPVRDHLLLADDLLARFPYREHPRNIALVRRLAVELGLDPDLATADMADHVVPDLGVLKAYPALVHRGRRLIFVNGMSANERTGFLSNWQRTGCEREVDQHGQHGQPEQPGRWVVTVVNNRFDRVARSKVFAEIIVRDASAERHILIGTNLSGLRVYIDQALTQLLGELQLFRSDDPEPQVRELLRARADRLRHRLRIGSAEPDAILMELKGWLGLPDAGALTGGIEAALVAAREQAAAGASLATIQGRLLALPLAQELRALMPDTGEDLAQHSCRSIARRALLASLLSDAERAVESAPERAAVVARQARLYRELFMDLVVAVEDSGASGDQVIDAIAGACPPGIEATVMGIQNIKGTGLDMVYRFIRYDEVNTLVQRLAHADGHSARAIAAALTTRSDFGMTDSALAASAVTDAAARLAAEPEVSAYLTHCAAQLSEIAHRCRTALHSGKRRRGGTGTRALSKLLDTLDAVNRRWRAEQILDALVHREISHERAALEARRLVDREKKGWLRR